METSAASSADQIFRHLLRFEFATECGLVVPFGLPNTERLIGVYRNSRPRLGDVWVTTTGLHIHSQFGAHLYIPYGEIRSASISDSESKPARHLVLALKAGNEVPSHVVVLVPILGVHGQFPDSYSFLRFVMRVSNGRLAIRERGCRSGRIVG
ncbi:MAG: hypothetical protein JO042_03785 [Sinobacteraceae bacterium]|nr:hypothetical protein [Nevskiaceae bacterium]